MRLDGKKVAFLIDEGFEDLEFWVTVMRLREEGAQVTIVDPDGKKHYRGKNGLAASADAGIEQVEPGAFDAVVIPGGWAPDKMRRSGAVKRFVGDMNLAGKIVGMICHAGLVGISAGIVKGHRATGSLGIMDDLVNAGATWVDEPLVVDRNMVSSRKPDDLPWFLQGCLQVLLSRPS